MQKVFINPILQALIMISGCLLSHNMLLIIYLFTIYLGHIWSGYITSDITAYLLLN